MSAETLRRAAALMWERAEKAAPGPWEVYANSEGPRVSQVGQVGFAAFGPNAATTAAHIASWHPAVAFAVADLLDNEASLIDGASERPNLHLPINGARVDMLTAVARAYLGESA